jgi:hypothetical protein
MDFLFLRENTAIFSLNILNTFEEVNYDWSRRSKTLLPQRSQVLVMYDELAELGLS